MNVGVGEFVVVGGGVVSAGVGDTVTVGVGVGEILVVGDGGRVVVGAAVRVGDVSPSN